MCTVGLPGAQESPLSFLLISLTSPVKVSPPRFTAGLAPGASPRLRKAAASLPRTNTRGRLSPASGELTRKETAQLLLKFARWWAGPVAPIPGQFPDVTRPKWEGVVPA